MSAADLVAVATVGSTLDVLTDFTGERERVDAALGHARLHRRARDRAAAGQHRGDRRSGGRGHRRRSDGRGERARHVQQRRPAARAAHARRDAGAHRAEEGHRLLQRRHAAQRPGQPRRAAGGDQRRRSAPTSRSTRSTSAGCRRSCPAATPARRAAAARACSPGRGMQQQFSQLAASQDTLTSLAGDTGGRAFTDTNDFGEAFTRVQRDMSAYYLLGYSSTNPAKDGRFRRVQVRVKREGLRVEARAGYYAATRLRPHEPRRSRNAAAGAAVRRRVGDRSAGPRHRRVLPARGGPATTSRSRWRSPAPR